MIAGYRKKANIGVGIGILALLADFSPTLANVSLPEPVSSLLPLIGAVLFLWGCWFYAKSKGYRGAWGLLGLLSLVGLIILALFPDISDAALGSAERAESATALGKPTSSRKISWSDYDFWAVILSVLGLAALYLALQDCSFPIYLAALATEVAAMAAGFYGLQKPSTRLVAEIGLLVAVLVLLAGFYFGFTRILMCSMHGNLL